MNPALAVKQYSRSSADQEVPLPHELRPVNVLRMTMTYLMAKIMNLCDTIDVNFAEWYHFLWDRTRGIRKDITQQELCSEEAVELVEQCARFHIHCSARLVAEDPSVFDQKINTENLTKCLQTLKYMYHDLELKGVRCKHEAEFRAYIILLNLNDGNFMWEVQQLRSDVQKSMEVQFALQVYSALDKNNYVRFFKLVHSTTYLNACILLRYFVQVRLSALKTILKCFSPRQPHKSYPLSELTEILAFESVDSTVDFLEYHGLVLTDDRTHVILDRRLFGMPEYPYAIDRAINVIESKRTCSVGEIVAGGQLITSLYENHKPQDSFDSFGRLNVAEILTDLNINLESDAEPSIEDVDGAEEDAKMIATERSKSPMFGDAKALFTTERSKSPLFADSKPATTTAPSTIGMFAAASESLFGKEKNVQTNAFEQFKFVVPKTEPPKPMFAFEPPKVVIKPSPPPKPDLIETQPPAFVAPSKIQPPIVFQPKKPPTPPQKPIFRFEPPKPHVEFKPPAPATPKPDLTQILNERLKQHAEEEQQRKNELIKQKLIRDAELERLQREKLEAAEIAAVVTATVKSLLDAVEERVKNEKLAEIAQRARLRKAGRCLKSWRETVRMRRKKRKAVDYGFAWLMPRTAKEEADELHTHSQSLVLGDMKRYKSGRAMEISIPPPPTVRRINLHDVCYGLLLGCLNQMEIKFPKELFWKVTVFLPHNEKHIEDIVNVCFGWKKANFILEQKTTVNQKITYCIEKQTKFHKTDANAYIFIANDLPLDIFTKNTTTPSVFLLQNPPSKTQILKTQFSHYKIFNCDKFTGAILSKLLVEALEFLARHLQKPPPLELDTLHSFLTLHFAGDIWKRIGGLAKWNSAYRDCLKRPQIAIKIFNDNLDKLAEIVFDGERKEFADFPDVFTDCLLSPLPEYLPCDYKYFPKFWKSEQYERVLKKTFDNFYISDYVTSWPPANEEILERDLFAFCEKNFLHPEKAFYKLMSVVLRKIDPQCNFKEIKNLLWTDLMETIALEKITESDFNYSDPQSVFNQLFVVYNSETLSKFLVSSWFYVNYPPIRVELKKLMVENQAKMVTKKKRKSDNDDDDRFSLELDIDLDEMLTQVTERFVDNQEKDLKMRKDVEEIQKLMSDLKESMEVQKKINLTFEKFALENL